jgi:hypothetical protein
MLMLLCTRQKRLNPMMDGLTEQQQLLLLLRGRRALSFNLCTLAFQQQQANSF